MPEKTKFPSSLSPASRVSLGENSRITIGSAILRVISGTVEEDVERLDATDNESGGYRQNSRGPFSLSIQAECFWRASDNAVSTAGAAAVGLPALNAGQLVTAAPLTVWPDFLNDQAGRYLLPTYYVERVSVNVEGTGNIKYSLSIASDGDFKLPKNV